MRLDSGCSTPCEKAGVAGFPDLPHASRADGREDFVGSEAGSRREVHVLAILADRPIEGMMQAPFDGRFKILAEEHPDLLLKLFGIVDRATRPELVHLLRELQLDAVEVDHVYRIGDDRLLHFEAITSWVGSRVPLLALYRFLLRQKYGLPVSSYVVLMAEKYAPKRLPARAVYEEADGFRIEAPYEVIRLWEVDPGLAFEPGCEALLPWVPLLKGDLAEFERAIEEIERLREHPERAPYAVDAMLGQLATLATLRYDRNVIGQLLGHLERKVMLTKEVFEVSWLYQDGKADGRVEGKIEGKIESLRMFLHRMFPGIGPLPDIDRIERVDVLDVLMQAVLQAKSEDDVFTAVQAAIRVN